MYQTQAEVSFKSLPASVLFLCQEEV